MSNYEQSLLEQLAAARAFANRQSQENNDLRRKLAQTEEKLKAAEHGQNAALAFMGTAANMFDAAQKDYDDKGRIDGPTGLLNKMAGAEEVQKLFRHALRVNKNPANPQALIIFVFDIDKFKLVNDTFGHGIGDKVIHAVAQQAHKTFGRPEDVLSSDDDNVVARDGGEEFVMAIMCDQNKSEEVAKFLAEKLRAAIEANCYILPNGEVGPQGENEDDPLRKKTISVGVAFITPNETHLLNIQAAIDDTKNRADAALYAAKGNDEPIGVGRNRVFLNIGGETMPSPLNQVRIAPKIKREPAFGEPAVGA